MREEHHHHHHHHYRDRHAYAYEAGEPGPGPNRHRLRRNLAQAKIAGVCAGLADYFGWRRKFVRLGLILATVFFFPMPVIAYVAAAVLIKPSGSADAAFQSTEEGQFWRTFSVKPKATFSELKHRFRALDARIAEMEYAVTSSEWGLRREFRDLERGV